MQKPLDFLNSPVFKKCFHELIASGYWTQRTMNIKKPCKELVKLNKYWKITLISPTANAPNTQLTPRRVMMVNDPLIWEILTRSVRNQV